ncbi:hypothetical protein C8F04DRAFT_1403739 [Mycena alexandri]|uniref:Uncharacterized protein n=1 Tax=Mycena alexandri TaxID=1745969 RepID=A0AAD6S4U3_9AGAR|nr:hypothetical protein C8F04DRAFT_1403739 [Mycena alexandri]
MVELGRLVCDTLVFVLTLHRAYVQRVSPLYTGSLIEKMVTDGGMYFGIIVIANLANLLTFYISDVLLSGFLSWLTTSLSVTLLSRLILNLHEAAGIAFEDEEIAMDPHSLSAMTPLFLVISSSRAKSSFSASLELIAQLRLSVRVNAMIEAADPTH